MKFADEDRPVRALTSDGRPFLSATLAIAVACGVAFAALPELRDYAKRLAFVAGDVVGIRPWEDEYSAAYKRLGIARLSAELIASSKISSSLARLAREPCDKAAMFAFGEALLAAHEGRVAADAYFAFAAGCPNSEGEQNRAAQILFQLGDSEKVIAITNELITKYPTVSSYRYLRGRALANMKRYAEALDDYKSTIELQKEPRDVGEWVFIEMANIYVAIGRPCDAAATIFAWAAIDPSARNTLKARKMVAEYSAKGCPQNPSPRDLRKL
jgi:tetratricopeptide (TPR) repeat protein